MNPSEGDREPERLPARRLEPPPLPSDLDPYNHPNKRQQDSIKLAYRTHPAILANTPLPNDDLKGLSRRRWSRADFHVDSPPIEVASSASCSKFTLGQEQDNKQGGGPKCGSWQLWRGSQLLLQTCDVPFGCRQSPTKPTKTSPAHWPALDCITSSSRLKGEGSFHFADSAATQEHHERQQHQHTATANRQRQQSNMVAFPFATTGTGVGLGTEAAHLLHVDPDEGLEQDREALPSADPAAGRLMFSSGPLEGGGSARTSGENLMPTTTTSNQLGGKFQVTRRQPLAGLRMLSGPAAGPTVSIQTVDSLLHNEGNSPPYEWCKTRVDSRKVGGARSSSVVVALSWLHCAS